MYDHLRCNQHIETEPVAHGGAPLARRVQLVLLVLQSTDDCRPLRVSLQLATLRNIMNLY